MNLISIYFFFPETLKEKTKSRINFTQGINNFVKAFSIPNLRKTFFIVLLITIGFTFFTQFFSVQLIKEFSYSESDIGNLYLWIGIWLVLTQAFIVRKLSNKIKPSRILSFSILFLGLSLLLILIPHQSIWFFLVTPLIAMSQGVTSPNLTTIVSQQARPDQQGEILGINQSMNSIGHIMPPIIGGYLLPTFRDGQLAATILGGYITTDSYAVPVLVGGVCILLAWLLFIIIRPGSNPSPTNQES